MYHPVHAHKHTRVGQTRGSWRGEIRYRHCERIKKSVRRRREREAKNTIEKSVV